ncbi:unnamed protein product [Acanthoscelides obtectus]|uniref:Uncharacterized protein n=1 Tax=Acanthoscelides obtectus TaxID=200917 RepID=A0A9P0LUC2_ACAOB|nr:unnamed protein product [Acanthoscelides obtectus]CAK1627568.1 hypothetical protein AOBTE_LOCUS4667 [Acanthoscelides obtectus]
MVIVRVCDEDSFEELEGIPAREYELSRENTYVSLSKRQFYWMINMVANYLVYTRGIQRSADMYGGIQDPEETFEDEQLEPGERPRGCCARFCISIDEFGVEDDGPTTCGMNKKQLCDAGIFVVLYVLLVFIFFIVIYFSYKEEKKCLVKQ